MEMGLGEEDVDAVSRGCSLLEPLQTQRTHWEEQPGVQMSETRSSSACARVTWREASTYRVDTNGRIVPRRDLLVNCSRGSNEIPSVQRSICT